MDRRDFIRSASLLSAASLVDPERVLAAPLQGDARYFDLHPFVAAHPEAVFIRATHVEVKIERTPLATYYLQRNYEGKQFEPYFHMVDEPYDYGQPTAVLDESSAQPRAFVLGQNYPNPFNASTLIEYRIPRDGRVRLEIYNARGQVVEVLVDDWRAGGSHVANWEAGRHASGNYFYRFRTEGFEETRKMVLVR